MEPKELFDLADVADHLRKLLLHIAEGTIESEGEKPQALAFIDGFATELTKVRAHVRSIEERPWPATAPATTDALTDAFHYLDNFIECLRIKKLIVRDTDTSPRRGVPNNVIEARFESGETFCVETGDRYGEVDALIQANLRPQFERNSDFRGLLHLEQNERYTLVVYQPTGIGCQAIQLTLYSVRVGKHAQYDDAVELIFFPKRYRRLAHMTFFGSRSFALWKNWISINTNAFIPVNSGSSMFQQMRSKYTTLFDSRYLTDAIASVAEEPLVIRIASRTGDE